MTVILIGAMLVICGVLYMAGRALWPGRFVRSTGPARGPGRPCTELRK